MHLNKWILSFLVALTLFGVGATEVEKKQKSLQSINQEISKYKQQLEKNRLENKRLNQLLRQDEQAISKVAKQLTITQDKLATSQAELLKLSQQIPKLQLKQQQQKKALAQQVKSAYMGGERDFIKTILSQDDAASFDRMGIYYRYLNVARIEAFEQFKQDEQQLNQKKLEQVEQQRLLDNLLTKQTEQRSNIIKQQAKRNQTLSALKDVILSKERQLEQLEIDSAALKQAIDRAVQLQKSSVKLKGLSRKKKLPWPVKGKVLKNFGKVRQGSVKWKGVEIEAKEGTRINAISDGKVLFSNWIKGFGMVIVLDHGEGYMSLYAQAQTLLKDTGDTVKKGERIALVGNSGGQSKYALYFELRHKGTAVNPSLYCR